MNVAALYKTRWEKTPYCYASFSDLALLLESPQKCAKNESIAISPHINNFKTKEVVVASDAMTLLWIDIDTGNRSLDGIKTKLQSIGIGSALIYSTASSTLNDKRWRVLIQLENAISCAEWVDIQEALSMLLNGDSSAVRVQQILYAPCTPANSNHYEYHVVRGVTFVTLPVTIEKIIDDLKAKRKIIYKRISQALTAIKGKSDAGIKLINESVDIEMIMEGYGYKRIGRKWRSPNSDSNTAGVILFTDGRWFSHHSSDSDIGQKVEGGCCGDAMDLIAYYEYGGDSKTCLAQLLDRLAPEAQKQRRLDWVKQQGSAA